MVEMFLEGRAFQKDIITEINSVHPVINLTVIVSNDISLWITAQKVGIQSSGFESDPRLSSFASHQK